MSPTELPNTPESDDLVRQRTQQWVVKAVIGLNLCPFAKAEHVHGRILYQVSHATTSEALRVELETALRELWEQPPEKVETTLLIHPWVLNDFLDFNDFMAEADETLDALNLAGHIQVANFHPGYQFADSAPDDIDNYTNRSPWPTLHLIREASIDRAVEAFPDAADIYEHNIAVLRQLGHEGWNKLWKA